MGGIGGDTVHRHVLDPVVVLKLVRDLIGSEGTWEAGCKGVDVSFSVNEIDRTKGIST